MQVSFEQLWSQVLNDCGMEQIPRAKLHVLALMAGPDDMRFLLKEAERMQQERQALRDDAGDMSDEYWRGLTSVAETLTLIGPAAAAFLLDEVDRPDSAHRLSAALLLPSVAAHADWERVTAMIAAEDDSDVRESLTHAFEKQTKARRRWWQFWKKA
jgi:hypothetical protein